MGRPEYFQERKIAFDVLHTANKRTYFKHLFMLERQQLETYTHFILEMTFSPSAIDWLRDVVPHAMIITRSHNAELLHRQDLGRSQGRTETSEDSLELTLTNFACDYESANKSDYLLSIDQWELEHYWKHLMISDKTLPEYTVMEFRNKTQYSIAKLYQAIHADYPDLVFSAKPETINWLNGVLETPEFFEKVLIRYPHFEPSQAIQTLRSQTQGLRHQPIHALSYLQTRMIKKMNRLLLEELYPQKSPQKGAMSYKGRWVPYFLPNRYKEQIPPAKAKKNICVNLTSSNTENPFLIDATKNFFTLVDQLNGKNQEWEFYSTGDANHYDMRPGRAQWTGYLASPYELLAQSRAMAILSEYGYGFKTKILEAIHTKNYVLMPENLYHRMPDILYPYCIPVDLHSVDSFQAALEKCREPFPESNVNAEFKRLAFDELDDIFFNHNR